MQIYKTTNLINGTIYIGYDTKNDPKYLGSGVHYKCAEKKYGKENFVKAIIDFADNKKDLCLKEIYWIKFHRDLGFELYNIADGGEGGNLGVEANKRISAALMGHELSDETKAKISMTWKGRVPNNKGKKVSVEARANIRRGALRRERQKWADRQNA